MIIDCIGCLHGALPKLDGGDLLIVTGDLTPSDKITQYESFVNWLNYQDYKKKIVIAGNHDTCLKYDGAPLLKWAKDCEYLCNSGTEFQGLKIWGSPWSSWFSGINPKCTAYTYKDQKNHYEKHLKKIPHDIDILITHEPAYGILDGIPQQDGSLEHVGSKALLNLLKYPERPKLHVFSHIHEAYGQEEYFPYMISVNCSIMNERYKPVNKPVRIVL